LIASIALPCAALCDEGATCPESDCQTLQLPACLTSLAPTCLPACLPMLKLQQAGGWPRAAGGGSGDLYHLLPSPNASARVGASGAGAGGSGLPPHHLRGSGSLGGSAEAQRYLDALNAFYLLALKLGKQRRLKHVASLPPVPSTEVGWVCGWGWGRVDWCTLALAVLQPWSVTDCVRSGSPKSREQVVSDL
jgi:hypothetical protein